MARGDAGTVAAHVDVISRAGADSADVLAAYRAMARATADRALASGRLAPTVAADLLAVLADPG